MRPSARQSNGRPRQRGNRSSSSRTSRTCIATGRRFTFRCWAGKNEPTRSANGGRSSAAAGDAIRAQGAVISHHHGVGQDHRAQTGRAPVEQQMLVQLKQTLDPDRHDEPGQTPMSRRRSRRSSPACPRRRYDVLIVGGGITGAGIVAGRRRPRTALPAGRKGDFASGTSSKSGKLIHGGLRYLKYRQWRLVFEACRERWLLQTKIAPHLVRPIRFVVPCYATSRTPRWMLALGLVWRTNCWPWAATRAFPDAFAAAAGRSWNRLSTRATAAAASPIPIARALDFRLVIDTLKSAEGHGADLLNYVELCERRQREPRATSSRASATC